jgi:hypothetical protein
MSKDGRTPKPITRRRSSQPSLNRIAHLARAMAQAASGTVAEPRALPILEDVPPGHALFRMDSRYHEPHLHEGEWIVYDTADRAVAFGELHLVLQSDGPCVWQINRWVMSPGMTLIGVSADDCACLSPLDTPRTSQQRTGVAALNLSHGPIRVVDILPDLLGRVVGILIDPALRSLRSLQVAGGRA